MRINVHISIMRYHSIPQLKCRCSIFFSVLEMIEENSIQNVIKMNMQHPNEDRFFFLSPFLDCFQYYGTFCFVASQQSTLSESLITSESIVSMCAQDTFFRVFPFFSLYSNIALSSVLDLACGVNEFVYVMC